MSGSERDDGSFEAATRMPLLVGNDVVDLTARRTRGKSSDARFLQRILTDDERLAVLRGDDPDGVLWRHWAAKEAAFKIVSKLHAPRPPFAHAEFEVQLGATPPHVGGLAHLELSRAAPGELMGGVPGPPIWGAVAWRGSVFACTLYETSSWVHAVCVHRPAPHGPSVQGPDDCVEAGTQLRAGVGAVAASADGAASSEDPAWSSGLTLREAAEAPAAESRAARLAAKAELAGVLGAAPRAIEILRWGGERRAPVRVLVAGRDAGVDLSLSHDGRWVAWAFSVTGQRQSGR